MISKNLDESEVPEIAAVHRLPDTHASGSDIDGDLVDVTENNVDVRTEQRRAEVGLFAERRTVEDERGPRD